MMRMGGVSKVFPQRLPLRYSETERGAEVSPMCGCYSQTSPAYVLARVFCVPAGPPLSPRYNVAPTQAVAVVPVGVPLAPSSDPAAPRRRTSISIGKMYI